MELTFRFKGWRATMLSCFSCCLPRQETTDRSSKTTENEEKKNRRTSASGHAHILSFKSDSAKKRFIAEEVAKVGKAAVPAQAFSFHDLSDATQNFNPDNLIGEGGFGCVYSGHFKSLNQYLKKSTSQFFQTNNKADKAEIFQIPRNSLQKSQLPKVLATCFLKKSHAQPLLKDKKKFPLIADPLLGDNYPLKSLHQALAIAAMCLQEEASVRPLMSDVVAALEFLCTGKRPEDEDGVEEKIMKTLSKKVD
ncbi:unnamed protein product, partial [Thlaspi arvense]